MSASARIQHADGPPPAVPGQAAQRYGGTSFRQVLADAFDSQVVTESARPTGHQTAVHDATARVRSPPGSGATPPPGSAAGTPSDALSRAMAAEGVPASWQPSLSFIMAQESGGRVGVSSAVHSARGLYQLTAANYHYNPHGSASFGNAVEEAQGGIRYIRARYGTAEKAAAFWRSHHWY